MRRPPTTTYAILGMLTFAERSGYELRQLIERSIGYFWSPAKSHIYAELRRLVELGWATEREVEQDDRPDKRVYGITEDGQRALREWLNDPEVEPATFKSPLLLKIFFGDLMDPDALRTQVAEAKRQAEEMLAELRAIEGRIKHEPALRHAYLTLACGLAQTRARRRWASETLKQLDGRSTG